MHDNQITPRINFISLLAYERPQAVAWVNGGVDYPRISGLVKFYQTSYGGILVEAELNITLRQSRLSGVARATFPDKQSHLVINYCIMF